MSVETWVTAKPTSSGVMICTGIDAKTSRQSGSFELLVLVRTHIGSRSRILKD
ncbi:MAG: hypothetical protein VX222_08185 [Actinomycetota bacterium]|nr:hypothetical protein [Actinomycetota bacterium]